MGFVASETAVEELQVEKLPADEKNADSVPQHKRKNKSQTKRKPLTPHAVILHNDSLNQVEFVVGVLKKVFNYTTSKSIWLTLKVHFAGKGVIWTGSLEVAELKADQVRSCGADPVMKSRGAQALKVTVEKMP